ncbi:MAG: hypothetical protein BM555_02320 [Crocinitomix sp. MedPE-SWsnd]|jgi:hypothetical protein|nr:MAG: hypothetical protein BM555_02320 [Crocinitomix sp. MedPE-SWsnd]
MVKSRLLTITILLFSLNSFSQEKDWKLNAALSFAPGFLTENTQSIQLHGYLGFLKDRIHVRGDGYYFLGNKGDRPRFNMNHQLYFGAFYHFSDKAFQPYVGFQPGIALTQSSEYGSWNEATQELEYKKAINPVGSPAAGFTYYGEKLFFLFAETRYIFGKHKTNSYPVFLDEWRFSFGLGFVF